MNLRLKQRTVGRKRALLMAVRAVRKYFICHKVFIKSRHLNERRQCFEDMRCISYLTFVASEKRVPVRFRYGPHYMRTSPDAV